MEQLSDAEIKLVGRNRYVKGRLLRIIEPVLVIFVPVLVIALIVDARAWDLWVIIVFMAVLILPCVWAIVWINQKLKKVEDKFLAEWKEQDK